MFSACAATYRARVLYGFVCLYKSLYFVTFFMGGRSALGNGVNNLMELRFPRVSLCYVPVRELLYTAVAGCEKCARRRRTGRHSQDCSTPGRPLSRRLDTGSEVYCGRVVRSVLASVRVSRIRHSVRFYFQNFFTLSIFFLISRVVFCFVYSAADVRVNLFK